LTRKIAADNFNCKKSFSNCLKNERQITKERKKERERERERGRKKERKKERKKDK
jgi:hypothetical protein